MTILNRKYIQFNDLVIDNYEMLLSADLSGGFKTATTEYSFGHGSYTNFKAKQQFSLEQSLSMTLKLDTRKLSKEQKKFYKDYVFMNIVKAGKLWAIEGEQLLWTNAFIKDFSESYSTERHIVNLDIDFVLYEGVWHKADTKKVFLKPYVACNFMECLDFQDIDECQDCCIPCSQTKHEPCAKCVCECEFLTGENSLCEMKKDIANTFYSQCGDTYQIIYNCEAGKKIWSEEKMLGHKICKKEPCKGLIAGQFYSDTLLDSESVTITLIGKFKDPTIKINGNTLKIVGNYDGKLTYTPSGDIYYLEAGCCKNPIEIAPSKLIIAEGAYFGYTIHHGTNSVLVEPNNCCDMVCIYIKEDRITI